MKKKFMLMLMVASCFGIANAQLVVNDVNGHVGIGIATADNLKSSLSVNCEGGTGSAVTIKPNNTTQYVGLYVGRTGMTPTNYQVAGQFHSTIVSAGRINVGLIARAYNESGVHVGSGRSIGIMSYAGHATNGYNYGVMGVLNGNSNGAGIYGSTEPNENGTDTGGRYAGFFNGNVHTTGTLSASGFATLSDYRVKRNIQSVTTNNSPLDNLMDMNVVQYNYIDVESAIAAASDAPDTATVISSPLSEEATINKEDIHYGLIAQELQKIYPNLVKEGRGGYLTINYIEIVPLLISSIQELKAEVDVLKGSSSPIKKAATRSAEEATDIDAVVNTLYQNEPNPFTESTVIRCDISKDVVQADLYIYNMNGDQIAEYAVTERGEASVTIDGGSLNAGMYLYALIADGKVIDTKRMILTK